MNLSNFVLALVAVSAAVGAASVPASAEKLDAGLYTTYEMAPDGSSVSYTVCGRVGGAGGCYGFGTLAQFQHACAVLEGKPKQKDNVITRALYVLDKRSSKTAPIVLNVFTRIDTIMGDSDTVQVTLAQRIPLGLTGGPKSKCSMAANDAYVYAATDVDTQAAAMNKATYEVGQLCGFNPPETVVSITADERGYIALRFSQGYCVFAPDGGGGGDGGGAADMVGTRSAWVPK